MGLLSLSSRKSHLEFEELQRLFADCDIATGLIVLVVAQGGRDRGGQCPIGATALKPGSLICGSEGILQCTSSNWWVMLNIVDG